MLADPRPSRVELALEIVMERDLATGNRRDKTGTRQDYDQERLHKWLASSCRLDRQTASRLRIIKSFAQSGKSGNPPFHGPGNTTPGWQIEGASLPDADLLACVARCRSLEICAPPVAACYHARSFPSCYLFHRLA